MLAWRSCSIRSLWSLCEIDKHLDVLALNGEVPQKGFNVEVAIYDSENSIIYQTSLSIIYQTSLSKYDGEFKGFEVFNFGTIRLDIPVDEISIIRIYPTR